MPKNDSLLEEGGLVKYLAVARVGKVDGKASADNVTIVAEVTGDKRDPNNKKYKSDIRNVVEQGCKKGVIAGGKRVQLVSPAYTIIFAGSPIPDCSTACCVFVMIVSPDYGAAHDVGKMHKEFKDGFFAAVTVNELLKSPSTCQKKGGRVMDGICKKYATSKIAQVSAQVASVKITMGKAIDQALANADNLDDLATQSAKLNDAANDFHTGATKLRRNQCLAAMKAKAIFFAIFLVLVGVIALAVWMATS